MAHRLPQADSPPSARIRYVVALAVLLLGGVFVALGIWQLERRTWKLALIERIDQRVHAPPVDAPGRARWPSVNVADDEYLHVRVAGRFLDDRATRVLAVTEYGRGSWLMVPLRTDDGDIVLVDRGYVSDGTKQDPSPAGPVVVTGLLRLTEPDGSLLHANDPAHDRWYSRDVAAIARVRGLQDVAPYFVDADAVNGGASRPEPIGGLTVIAFRNDHLIYAITWFALAALCAWALRRLLRTQSSGDEHDHDQ